MKQSLDASEKRVEQKLENRFSTFDGKFDDLSERLDQAETGRIRSDDNFSELIDSMSRRLEQIEKDRSAGDSSLGESVDKITRRLEQVDQDRTSNERTISEAVGNIARRLEQVEQDRPANAQPVDLDASSIPTRLAQLEQDQSDNSSAENNQFAELRDQLVAEKTRNQEALTEIRSTLAEIKDELGNPASTQTRSSYSDLGIENISDSTDVSGTDREGNDRSVTEIIEELTAVHEADIAPSDKSSEDDLPEHRDSVEAMSAAPSPFELPPIDPSDPVSLAAEGMRASAPEDDESDLDEEPLEDQDDSDVTEDYLSEARRAAQAAADAAPAAGTQSSPLQSLKTRLMGSEAKLQLSQKNKIAAIAAALLLLVGGAAVLFLRGSETVPNDRIAGVVTAVPVEQPSLEASLAATPSLEQGADEAIFPGSETAELTPVPTTVSTDALAEDVNASTVSGPAMSAPQASVTGGQTPLETLVSQARGGSSPAALILGLKYLNGDGVAASESEAFR